MATLTKLITITGAITSDLTTAYAYPLDAGGDSSGTVIAATAAEILSGVDKTKDYVVSVTCDDATELVGPWIVGLGAFGGYEPKAEVPFVAGSNVYRASGASTQLTGDNAITVTVENSDDDEPIENAKVRFYRSGQSETKATDVDGLTEAFGLDTATWSYVVSATGFTSKTGTLVVSADSAVTYQLDPVSQEPLGTGNACRCTLGVVSLDETPITGAILSAATKDKNAFVGNSLVFPEQDKPTSADGVITVYLIRGLEYDIAVRYNRKEVKFSFACPDSSSANMGEIVV